MLPDRVKPLVGLQLNPAMLFSNKPGTSSDSIPRSDEQPLASILDQTAERIELKIKFYILRLCDI